jgi:hypothetical protein
MVGKRIVALSLFALAVLTIGLFASSGAEAVGTYKPVGIYSLLTDMPGVASSTVTNVTIPSPDYNYEDSSMYNLSPIAGWVAPGELFPIGAWMGHLSSVTSLGVTNKACNLPVYPFFKLFNASLDTSQQLTVAEMAWTNTSTPPPNAYLPANGLPDYLEKYPHFLNLMLDPDGPHGPKPPLEPRARYAGHTNVVGSYMLIQIVVLSPGQIAQLPSIKTQMAAGMGYAVLTVLNNPVDQLEKPGSVSDFCTSLQSVSTLYGTTQPGGPVAGGPYGVGAGLVSQINPANNSGIMATNTHLNRTYSQSERDVDSDGWENDMDPCFYQANTGWDPRDSGTCLTGGTKAGDIDCDGLPDICDPDPQGDPNYNPDPIPNIDCVDPADQADCDKDQYNNQQDICPLVADGPQTALLPGQNQIDSDGLVDNADKGPQPDSIGNACDDSDDDGNEDGAGVGTCNDGLDNGGDFVIDGNDPDCIPKMDKGEMGFCRNDIDDDPVDDGTATGTWINDGCPIKGTAVETDCGPNETLPLDDDADTRVNDGCVIKGAAVEPMGVADGAEATIWGTNPGSGLYFHAMPWAPVCVGGAETGAQCDGNADDDVDGKVNDGCPPVGLPEGDLDSTECDDALDENTLAPNDEGDAAADKVNDGCPTVNPDVDADGDTYCNATECVGTYPGGCTSGLVSDPAVAGSKPESYVIDASIIAGLGPPNGANPAAKVPQSCSDGIDNDADTLTDTDPGCVCPVADDTDCDGICDPGDSNALCIGSDNCPTVWNPDQTNLDGEGEGNACDPDDDNDLFSDVIEYWMGTDPLDNCRNTYGTLTSDAWPLDQDRDGKIKVVPDVTSYTGKIGFTVYGSPPASWVYRRLDMDMDGKIKVVPDVTSYTGKIGLSCT